MSAQTERITLPDGAWWEVRTTLSRAMEKAITRASLASVPKMEAGDGTDVDALKAKLMSNVGAIDIGAIEDAYLLHGTIATSFGIPLTIAEFDKLPADVTRIVINRMMALYAEQRLTQEQRDGFFGTRSSVT